MPQTNNNIAQAFRQSKLSAKYGARWKSMTEKKTQEPSSAMKLFAMIFIALFVVSIYFLASWLIGAMESNHPSGSSEEW
jgi:hypothetical protein